MALYYSERTLSDAAAEYLRKLYRRGIIDSNTYEITRANTIDYHLLLEYFDIAIIHSKNREQIPINFYPPSYHGIMPEKDKYAALRAHNIYEIAVTLPEDLEDRIPFWFIENNGEIWIDPKSGPKGKNIYGEVVFVVRFSLYTDDKSIHSLADTKNLSANEALLREFRQIRHDLIDGDEEAIEIFKEFYGNHNIGITPKTQAGEYLINILKPPH